MFFDTRLMLGVADGLLFWDWWSFGLGLGGNIVFVYSLW